MTHPGRKPAFSLLELLLSVSVFALIALFVSSSSAASVRSGLYTKQQANLIQQAQSITQRLANQLVSVSGSRTPGISIIEKDSESIFSIRKTGPEQKTGPDSRWMNFCVQHDEYSRLVLADSVKPECPNTGVVSTLTDESTEVLDFQVVPLSVVGTDTAFTTLYSVYLHIRYTPKGLGGEVQRSEQYPSFQYYTTMSIPTVRPAP
jgi:prepilin-type N-terminal cleavage/methylation domain-containing protein